MRPHNFGDSGSSHTRHYISALRGYFFLKILHALEIDQGLLAHTTTGTEVSPKKFNCKKIKICPRIPRVRPHNFGDSGNSLTKFFQITCREGGVIMWVQFLEGPPLKFGRPQRRQNFGAISDNFRLLSRIFPYPIVISSIWKKLDQLQPFARWKKEIRWTLVYKRKSSGDAYSPTLSALSV